MALELEYLFIGSVFGLGLGFLLARNYYRSRIEIKNIGHVIQYAVIHKDIKRLSSLTSLLKRLIIDINEVSSDIAEKLELSKDIEEDYAKDRDKEQ